MSSLREFILPIYKKNESNGDKKKEGGKEIIESVKTSAITLVLYPYINENLSLADEENERGVWDIFSWINSGLRNSASGLEIIGQKIKRNYESLNTRATFNCATTPTFNKILEVLSKSREDFKSNRMIFHYLGPNCPPAYRGKLWFWESQFSKKFEEIENKQIISSLGSPGLLIYDVSYAGKVIEDTIKYFEQKDFILFGSSSATEKNTLVQNLPNDLFTCCLISPVKTSINWFVRGNIPRFRQMPLIIDVPGNYKDRKTINGQLHWVLTAIQETIAFEVLPGETFTALFRNETLVSSLYRNFLLAKHILGTFGVHPVSFPSIPDIEVHSLWTNWESALEEAVEAIRSPSGEINIAVDFFQRLLTTFEFYNAMGTNDGKYLPAILQAILAQNFRLRAFSALADYINLGGDDASTKVSTVGFGTYIVRLLPCSKDRLQPILLFIWGRIMAVDEKSLRSSIENDFYKLFTTTMCDAHLPDETRSLAAHCLLVMISYEGVQPIPIGQCGVDRIVDGCYNNLGNECKQPQFYLFLLAKIFCQTSKYYNFLDRKPIVERICSLFKHGNLLVRAAAVYSLRFIVTDIWKFHRYVVLPKIEILDFVVDKLRDLYEVELCFLSGNEALFFVAGILAAYETDRRGVDINDPVPCLEQHPIARKVFNKCIFFMRELISLEIKARKVEVISFIVTRFLTSPPSYDWIVWDFSKLLKDSDLYQTVLPSYVRPHFTSDKEHPKNVRHKPSNPDPANNEAAWFYNFDMATIVKNNKFKFKKRSVHTLDPKQSSRIMQLKYRTYNSDLFVLHDLRKISVISGGVVKNVVKSNLPISCFELINDHDNALTLTISNQHVVNVYRNEKGYELIRCWKASLSPEMEVCSAWSQNFGLLAISDKAVITLWDLETELMTIKLTCPDSLITSLTFDTSGNKYVAASCMDGSVHVYDLRDRFTCPFKTAYMKNSSVSSVILDCSVSNHLLCTLPAGRICSLMLHGNSNPKEHSLGSNVLYSAYHPLLKFVACCTDDYRISFISSEYFKLIGDLSLKCHGMTNQPIKFGFHPLEGKLALSGPRGVVNVFEL